MSQGSSSPAGSTAVLSSPSNPLSFHRSARLSRAPRPDTDELVASLSLALGPSNTFSPNRSPHRLVAQTKADALDAKYRDRVQQTKQLTLLHRWLRDVTELPRQEQKDRQEILQAELKTVAVMYARLQSKLGSALISARNAVLASPRRLQHHAAMSRSHITATTTTSSTLSTSSSSLPTGSAEKKRRVLPPSPPSVNKRTQQQQHPDGDGGRVQASHHRGGHHHQHVADIPLDHDDKLLDASPVAAMCDDESSLIGQEATNQRGDVYGAAVPWSPERVGRGS